MPIKRSRKWNKESIWNLSIQSHWNHYLVFVMIINFLLILMVLTNKDVLNRKRDQIRDIQILLEVLMESNNL